MNNINESDDSYGSYESSDLTDEEDKIDEKDKDKEGKETIELGEESDISYCSDPDEITNNGRCGSCGEQLSRHDDKWVLDGYKIHAECLPYKVMKHVSEFIIEINERKRQRVIEYEEHLQRKEKKKKEKEEKNKENK
jgi:hypothetical protein